MGVASRPAGITLGSDRPIEHWHFWRGPSRGGDGPSHATINLIWLSADAAEYLPPEGTANKMNRVLTGLRVLASGGKATEDGRSLSSDETKLRHVVADLATRLIAGGSIDQDDLDAALEKDGFRLDDQELAPIRPTDEPADRISAHVDELFGTRPDMTVARNHYEQANRAFDRADWEAANSQFRSACDAVYDALARSQGCPVTKTGGRAR